MTFNNVERPERIIQFGEGGFLHGFVDWNKPSIDFYLSLGAVPMDEWTVYRLTGDTLIEMSK